MEENLPVAAEAIRIVDNSDYVPQIDPTYVALGFMDEYTGRSVYEGGETVERFYPGEANLVPRFVAVLEEIAERNGIRTRIRQEIGPQGHIAVISRELSAHLDNLYRPDFSAAASVATDLNGRKWRYVIVGVDATMFPSMRSRQWRPEEVDCRFSYLLGSHIRYGEDNAFRLANATHKVELIIAFLESLGAAWVEWSRSLRTVPMCHRVRFGPDAVLARALGLRADLVSGDQLPF